MNEGIKAGGSAVSLSRLSSGAQVKEAPKKTETKEPKQAVDSVVNEVGKARESVEKISDAATYKIEVAKQNESSSQSEVRDIENAARLAQDLELNIRKREGEANRAHDLSHTSKIKDLLK